MTRIPVKICGVTSPQQASEIAALGVEAIGLVFYPPSPRHVNEDQARSILAALPPSFPVVGVLVNEPVNTAAAKAERLGLRFLQLHGTESPETVTALQCRGFYVIKALHARTASWQEEANRWPVDIPLLVECPSGDLPGGTGTQWNWKQAAPLAQRRPLILAGGLTPENIGRAVAEVQPAALDVSSGVEERPGIKSLEKIRRLLDNLARLPWIPSFPSPWKASNG